MSNDINMNNDVDMNNDVNMNNDINMNSNWTICEIENKNIEIDIELVRISYIMLITRSFPKLSSFYEYSTDADIKNDDIQRIIQREDTVPLYPEELENLQKKCYKIVLKRWKNEIFSKNIYLSKNINNEKKLLNVEWKGDNGLLGDKTCGYWKFYEYIYNKIDYNIQLIDNKDDINERNITVDAQLIRQGPKLILHQSPRPALKPLEKLSGESFILPATSDQFRWVGWMPVIGFRLEQLARIAEAQRLIVSTIESTPTIPTGAPKEKKNVSVVSPDEAPSLTDITKLHPIHASEDSSYRYAESLPCDHSGQGSRVAWSPLPLDLRLLCCALTAPISTDGDGEDEKNDEDDDDYDDHRHLCIEYINIDINKSSKNTFLRLQGGATQHLPLMKHYERLEYFGDGILALLAALSAFNKLPDLQEGPLTDKKIELACNFNLRIASKHLSLETYLIQKRFSRKRSKEPKSVSYKTQADIIESLLGVIYLSSLHAARVHLLEDPSIINGLSSIHALKAVGISCRQIINDDFDYAVRVLLTVFHIMNIII
eukprot:GHVL01040294.1.p1 GENE.GHVL01040294.1~~GHVL01040294.1.p1  ORF type:complete len:578 (+),score=151.00 GHVL01040294.1:106-1734(+)